MNIKFTNYKIIMSKSFTKKFANSLFFIFDNRMVDKLSLYKIQMRVILGTTLLTCHGLYSYLTYKNETITVIKKYKINRNGFTELMIIDNNGRHYNLINSFWYWKWNSIEDWHKIEENEGNLFIKYYGWRIPLLGLFPNIIKTEKTEKYEKI